jgi:hypothetical protein
VSTNLSGQNPKKVVKWGAGLDNVSPNTTFSTTSGEFHTWGKGFSTDGCGTRAPIDGSYKYFFLKGVPENSGKVPTIEENQKDLNYNFELVTTPFNSGLAEQSDYNAYIKKFTFGTHDCEEIHCCYVAECASCTDYDYTKCKYTTYSPPSGTMKVDFLYAVGLGLVNMLLYTH